MPPPKRSRYLDSISTLVNSHKQNIAPVSCTKVLHMDTPSTPRKTQVAMLVRPCSERAKQSGTCLHSLHFGAKEATEIQSRAEVLAQLCVRISRARHLVLHFFIRFEGLCQFESQLLISFFGSG